VVIIAALAVVFFLMRRRQKAQIISKRPGTAGGEAYYKPELSGEGARAELQGQTGVAEKDGQARSELPSGDDNHIYELGTGNERIVDGRPNNWNI